MIKHKRFLVMHLLLTSGAIAQNHVSPEREYENAIEDNSFLIEEAYNQEGGIVQHIVNALRFSRPQNDVTCTFTQEWPVSSQQHQLSFSIPYQFLNANVTRGTGDILLNYRYQLLGGDDWAALAPRVSLILPTGDKGQGLGMGTAGVQWNIPLSKRINNALVAHVNAGFTLYPGAERTTSTGLRVRRTLTSYNAGASVIWLSSYRLNFMAEFAVNISGGIGDEGEVSHAREYILNPGIRHAFDLGSLQIVPGVSIPVSFIETGSRTGIFLYLSAEHPF